MSEKRKVDKRLRRKKRRMLFIILILVIVLFFLIAFKTTLFIISNIEVRGNKKLTTDQVIKAIGNPKGENIFRISLNNMADNLDKHPYIKESVIKRKIPNKLLVNVKEREERLVLSMSNFNSYIDEEGFVLRIEPSIDSESLPIIKGININNPIIGEKINSDQYKYIDEMLDLIDVSIKLKLLNKMVQLDFSNVKDVTIILNNGISVAFGPLNNVKYKLNYINEILKDIEQKNIKCKYIYFNRGENPVIVIDND